MGNIWVWNAEECNKNLVAYACCQVERRLNMSSYKCKKHRDMVEQFVGKIYTPRVVTRTAGV
jgi:hypothetical protein